MRALGYNVALHRTLAFAFGAFIAALAGILSVWWNLQISPGLDRPRRDDRRPRSSPSSAASSASEGAWVGALVFALLDNYDPHEIGASSARSGSTP